MIRKTKLWKENCHFYNRKHLQNIVRFCLLNVCLLPNHKNNFASDLNCVPLSRSSYALITPTKRYQLSPGVRKPTICIWENNDCEADHLVFATLIVQYLFFLNTKFQASSYLQWLFSLVCVRPGHNPNCWLSHAGLNCNCLGLELLRLLIYGAHLLILICFRFSVVLFYFPGFPIAKTHCSCLVLVFESS